MSDQEIHVGDRVRIYLDPRSWQQGGWLPGIVVKIDPYSEHRSFYWVRLDPPVDSAASVPAGPISVLNPKNIEKL